MRGLVPERLAGIASERSSILLSAGDDAEAHYQLRRMGRWLALFEAEQARAVVQAAAERVQAGLLVQPPPATPEPSLWARFRAQMKPTVGSRVDEAYRLFLGVEAQHDPLALVELRRGFGLPSLPEGVRPVRAVRFEEGGLYSGTYSVVPVAGTELEVRPDGGVVYRDGRGRGLVLDHPGQLVLLRDEPKAAAVAEAVLEEREAREVELEVPGRLGLEERRQKRRRRGRVGHGQRAHAGPSQSEAQREGRARDALRALSRRGLDGRQDPPSVLLPCHSASELRQPEHGHDGPDLGLRRVRGSDARRGIEALIDERSRGPGAVERYEAVGRSWRGRGRFLGLEALPEGGEAVLLKVAPNKVVVRPVSALERGRWERIRVGAEVEVKGLGRIREVERGPKLGPKGPDRGGPGHGR